MYLSENVKEFNRKHLRAVPFCTLRCAAYSSGESKLVIAVLAYDGCVKRIDRERFQPQQSARKIGSSLRRHRVVHVQSVRTT